MKALLSNITTSISELKRSPSAVLNKARGRPVALLNRNEVVCYLVPADSVDQHEEVSLSSVSGLMDEVLSKNAVALDNLKDR